MVFYLNFCYVQACSLRKMWMWICLKPGPTPSIQAHWAFLNFYCFYIDYVAPIFFVGRAVFLLVVYFMHLVNETNILRWGKTVHVVFENIHSEERWRVDGVTPPQCPHSLNMQVDLLSLFGLHVTWCAQLYSLAETPAIFSLPPHLDSYYEGAIGQQR
jgi:hypothetical protein